MRTRKYCTDLKSLRFTYFYEFRMCVLHIQYIIPKLSRGCFVMRRVTSLMKTEALKLVYFAYFNSVISYVIILVAYSTDSEKSTLYSKENNKNNASY